MPTVSAFRLPVSGARRVSARLSRGAVRSRAALLACLLAGALAGCASTASRGPAGLPPAGGSAAAAQGGTASNFGPQYCRNFYEVLERQTRARQVLDAGQHRLPGYLFLRSNRLLSSFGDDFEQALAQAAPDREARQDAVVALAGSESFRAWLEQLRRLDATVRRHEIERLPDAALPLYHHHDRQAIITDVERCSQVLMRQLGQADVPELLRQAHVPDEYQRLLRALGLYPLTGMGVASSIRNWEDHQRTVFRTQRKASFSGRAAFQRYRPASLLDDAEARRQAAAVMAGVARDALGIPLFTDEQLQVLVQAYAPSYDIATINDADRIGRLRWIDLGGLVRDPDERYWLDVDTSQPVVYQRLEFTRFDGKVLPQLIYTVWFSERPMESSSDLQAGRLDGLVWRVTLDDDGAPLAYDSIQPSGRYAMFFPSRRLQPDRAAAQSVESLAEWLYSPIDVAIEDWVGTPWPAQLSLHVSSRTHQLVGISLLGETWGTPVFDNPPYLLVAEDTLRALPLPEGGNRSIYNQDGFVPDTERLGRVLLWTMGVRNMGAIRQPGRQPTALVGRRHFDDARLFQQRYQRVPMPDGQGDKGGERGAHDSPPGAAAPAPEGAVQTGPAAADGQASRR
ncbi:MAG: hypothetical protein Q4E06_04385 [Lautropia sp.]|nr:hypothetical protein [Lautropia sp.]